MSLAVLAGADMKLGRLSAVIAFLLATGIGLAPSVMSGPAEGNLGSPLPAAVTFEFPFQNPDLGMEDRISDLATRRSTNP